MGRGVETSLICLRMWNWAHLILFMRPPPPASRCALRCALCPLRRFPHGPCREPRERRALVCLRWWRRRSRPCNNADESLARPRGRDADQQHRTERRAGRGRGSGCSEGNKESGGEGRRHARQLQATSMMIACERRREQRRETQQASEVSEMGGWREATKKTKAAGGGAAVHSRDVSGEGGTAAGHGNDRLREEKSREERRSRRDGRLERSHEEDEGGGRRR